MTGDNPDTAMLKKADAWLECFPGGRHASQVIQVIDGRPFTQADRMLGLLEHYQKLNRVHRRMLDVWLDNPDPKKSERVRPMTLAVRHAWRSGMRAPKGSRDRMRRMMDRVDAVRGEPT